MTFHAFIHSINGQDRVKTGTLKTGFLSFSLPFFYSRLREHFYLADLCYCATAMCNFPTPYPSATWLRLCLVVRHPSSLGRRSPTQFSNFKSNYIVFVKVCVVPWYIYILPYTTPHISTIQSSIVSVFLFLFRQFCPGIVIKHDQSLFSLSSVDGSWL